jgi:Flp pilus assembly protein TadD
LAARAVALTAAKAVTAAELQKQGLELADPGRYPQAVAAFRRALDRVPNDPGLLNDLGHALGKQADAAASRAALEAAVACVPPTRGFSAIWR